MACGELLDGGVLGGELLDGELLDGELLGCELPCAEFPGAVLELGLLPLRPVRFWLAVPFPVAACTAAPAGWPSATAMAADDTTPTAPMRVVRLLTRRSPSSRAATAKRTSSRRMSPSSRSATVGAPAPAHRAHDIY